MKTVRVLGVLEMPLQGLLVACVEAVHHEDAARLVRAVRTSARGAFTVLEFWRRERLTDVHWEGFHPSAWNPHLASSDFALVVLGRPTVPPGLARLADAVVYGDAAGWHVLETRAGGADAAGLYGGSSGVGGSSGDGAQPAVGGSSGGSGSGSGGHR